MVEENDTRCEPTDEDESEQTRIPSVGRRRFLAVAGAGVGAVSLAGCSSSNGGDTTTGGGGGGSTSTTTSSGESTTTSSGESTTTSSGESTTTSSGESTTTSATTGGETGETTGSAGTSSAGTSSAGTSGGDTITLGFLATLQSDLGKGGLRSARLAVEDINDDGGIDGRQVELVKGDTQSKPSQASTVVQSLINSKGVDALFGTWVSEVTLGIMDRVSRAGVPFFVTGSASPKITANYAGKSYDKYKNFFRVSPFNSNIEADHLGDYAKFLSDTHGWNSFAVAVEDAAWTKPVTDRTPGAIEDNGMDVTMTKRFSPDTSDFTPILDKVKDSGADVLFKAIAHIAGTGLLSTWGENEYPFAQEGINIASMSPHYWKDTNGGCLYESTGLSPAGVMNVTDKTEPFVKKYQEKYSSRPSLPMFMGMGTYDAVHIYKNAIEDAGTADYENGLDDIVGALSETDYTGVSGQIQFFGKDSDYPNDVKYGVDKQPFTIAQWQTAESGQGLGGTDGKKVGVWQEKYATGKHKAPPWMS